MAPAAALLLVSLLSSGLTINVPGDQPTIAAAISAANHEDEVVVSPGTYNEYDLDFAGKAITVRSTDPNDPGIVIATVVDAMSQGSGFILENGEGRSSTITGLTIRNADSWWGGGILCWRASPTIANCLIESCVVYSYGGGIGVWDGAPLISGCVIRNNVADSSNPAWGGGIAIKQTVWATAEADIEDCIVYNNAADGGGGIWVDADLWYELVPAEIRRCVIKNNVADRGSGLYLFRAKATVENCVIAENHGELQTSAIYGAGIYAGGGEVLVANTVIARNRAVDCFWGEGGGIYLITADATLSNCAIFDNRAKNLGGGISVTDFASITNTIIWGNTPDSIVSIGEEITVAYSDVQGAWPGTGNLNVDPLTTDWNGYEYLLQRGSPCMDSGDPSIADGISWPLWYGNDRTRSDMGAYGGPGGPGWWPPLIDQ